MGMWPPMDGLIPGAGPPGGGVPINGNQEMMHTARANKSRYKTKTSITTKGSNEGPDLYDSKVSLVYKMSSKLARTA